MMRFKKLLAVVGATAMLALAAPAVYAADSGTDGYSGNNTVAGLEQGGGTDSPTPTTNTTTPTTTNTTVQAADEGGSLPFTGADLGVLAAAGAMLLALGFGLRRLTHRPTA
jgi:hypothetical protein